MGECREWVDDGGGGGENSEFMSAIMTVRPLEPWPDRAGVAKGMGNGGTPVLDCAVWDLTRPNRSLLSTPLEGKKQV